MGVLPSLAVGQSVTFNVNATDAPVPPPGSTCTTQADVLPAGSGKVSSNCLIWDAFKI